MRRVANAEHRLHSATRNGRYVTLIVYSEYWHSIATSKLHFNRISISCILATVRPIASELALRQSQGKLLQFLVFFLWIVGCARFCSADDVLRTFLLVSLRTTYRVKQRNYRAPSKESTFSEFWFQPWNPLFLARISMKTSKNSFGAQNLLFPIYCTQFQKLMHG